jgi:1,4-alpha-glucan branching enzyme
MRQRGHVPPADRPERLRDAAIYGFHPGGTFCSYCTDLGGFRPAMKLLEHIAGLGFNTVWILPIQDVSSYSPRDYYAIQEGLGTAEEYRALIDRAHQLGLHVLQDCAPHGGRSDYPRAKQHPEWLAYKEGGSTLVYWCFDFNWPSWRDYMAGVVRHYVHDFDVNGFRVDAIEGSLVRNWNPAIPYARASFARLQGGMNMLRSMRVAAKQEKLAAAMLCETERSVYATVASARKRLSNSPILGSTRTARGSQRPRRSRPLRESGTTKPAPCTCVSRAACAATIATCSNRRWSTLRSTR